jgi:hypothetical protein
MTLEQRVTNLEKVVTELLKQQLEERSQAQSFEDSIKQMTAILPVVQELNRAENDEMEKTASIL